MSIQVKIPAVGESISSGVLSTWHKRSGDYVDSGEILFTLETDKVSTEITAEKAGTLKIDVDAGTEVKIGEVVGQIDDSAAKPNGATATSPAATGHTTPATDSTPKSSPAANANAPISPASRRMLEEEKVSPTEVSGSGKGGRITKADIQAAIEARQQKGEPALPSSLSPSSAPAPAKQPVGKAAERVTRKKLSPLRRKIAAQLVMAQQTAAILSTFNECDMSGVMALRAKLQDSFTKRHGIKLGFMSFFIKAVVDALKLVPAVNGRLEGDEFVQNHYYDIGVAVGTERGLIVPVVRNADTKSFAEIEAELVQYAQRAREGKIKIEDLEGGVFTISNGGVYGSLLSTPILNPPQSGILGMHNIVKRPIAIGDEVVVRPMMYLALSYDHRVVDGKEAVTFLVRVKECIEDPTRLLLET